MKGSKPKNRKPSVAVSRRFSCSEAFNFSERIEKCSSYSKEEKRKVLWKGIDATPLPFFIVPNVLAVIKVEMRV